MRVCFSVASARRRQLAFDRLRIVGEACGERDARPQEANLFDLQAKYAEVVSEAQALALMSR